MKDEKIIVYSYLPTFIFDDLWHIEVFKHEIFYQRYLFFFKRRVRRTTTLYSHPHQKGHRNYAQEFVDSHPEIKLGEYKWEYSQLPEVK